MRVRVGVKSVWIERSERTFSPLRPSCDTVYLQMKVAEVPRRGGGGDAMGAFKLIVYCKNRKPDIHKG